MESGFTLVFKDKELFYKTDCTRKTKAVIFAFIDQIAKLKNIHPDVIQRAKDDKATIEDFRKRIQHATIEDHTIYRTITGENFTANYPEDIFNNTVIIF